MDDAADGVASSEAATSGQQQQCISYVRGMLTNLGAMPLTRIHTTLGMFFDRFEMPAERLRVLLDGLVQQGVLVFAEGKYALAS